MPHTHSWHNHATHKITTKGPSWKRKPSGLQAEASDGSTDVLWSCLGSNVIISGGFFSIGLHYVSSHLTCVSVTEGWSHWATVFIALGPNREKSPVIISKPIKKLRCFHFLDQSAMEIKEEPCCTLRGRWSCTAVSYNFSFIFSLCWITMPHSSPSISFLPFRNGEIHPSKVSNRPVFKDSFSVACGSRSSLKFSKGIINSWRTTELRPLPYFGNVYFLIFCLLPSIRRRWVWRSFESHFSSML